MISMKKIVINLLAVFMTVTGLSAISETTLEKVFINHPGHAAEMHKIKSMDPSGRARGGTEKDQGGFHGYHSQIRLILLATVSDDYYKLLENNMLYLTEERIKFDNVVYSASGVAKDQILWADMIKAWKTIKNGENGYRLEQLRENRDIDIDLQAEQISTAIVKINKLFDTYLTQEIIDNAKSINDLHDQKMAVKKQKLKEKITQLVQEKTQQ